VISWQLSRLLKFEFERDAVKFQERLYGMVVELNTSRLIASLPELAEKELCCPG